MIISTNQVISLLVGASLGLPIMGGFYYFTAIKLPVTEAGVQAGATHDSGNREKMAAPDREAAVSSPESPVKLTAHLVDHSVVAKETHDGHDWGRYHYRTPDSASCFTVEYPKDLLEPWGSYVNWGDTAPPEGGAIADRDKGAWGLFTKKGEYPQLDIRVHGQGTSLDMPTLQDALALEKRRFPVLKHWYEADGKELVIKQQGPHWEGYKRIRELPDGQTASLQFMVPKGQLAKYESVRERCLQFHFDDAPIAERQPPNPATEEAPSQVAATPTPINTTNVFVDVQHGKMPVFTYRGHKFTLGESQPVVRQILGEPFKVEGRDEGYQVYDIPRMVCEYKDGKLHAIMVQMYKNDFFRFTNGISTSMTTNQLKAKFGAPYKFDQDPGSGFWDIRFKLAEGCFTAFVHAEGQMTGISFSMAPERLY